MIAADDLDRHEHSSASLSELRLWLTVLEQAFRDACLGEHGGREWWDWTHAPRYICDALGLDWHWVRRRYCARLAEYDSGDHETRRRILAGGLDGPGRTCQAGHLAVTDTARRDRREEMRARYLANREAVLESRRLAYQARMEARFPGWTARKTARKSAR